MPVGASDPQKGFSPRSKKCCGASDWRVNGPHLEYSDIYGILDPYYIGVVEGMVRHYGFEPHVRIHAIDIAVLDIRW
jgi:hypothetical protein